LFRIETLGTLSRSAPTFLLLAGIAAVVFTIGDGVSQSQQFESVGTFLLLVLRFFASAGQALSMSTKIVNDTQTASGALFDESSRQQSSEEAAVPRVASVDFEDVTFAFAGRAPILHRANLALRLGQSYALVGASGIGKSTCADLLLKFKEPDEGAILVNGVDIERLSTPSLRRRIVLLSQNAAIFNDSIRSNLTFGSEQDESALIDACRQCLIHDEIVRMPNGFDTLLQYQGSNLSGGQRQRIMLARALLRRPDVLVLDESISAIDPVARSAIVTNLLDLFRDKIIVFIAHDADIVRRVTTRVEMIDGRFIVG
jgi:ABC-type multidrug transport system fused ATPase/permease subunit